MNKPTLTVIGAGLAGTEAAWQAAENGIHVTLFEMRPTKMTPAHVTHDLAELVCSNSLGSVIINKAPGLLKAEMRGLGSILLECAQKTAVPAGSSLAVDREGFAELISTRIEQHPNIELVREELSAVPDTPTIVCTGPLTSNDLAADIVRLSGQDHLYFYDALSPIVAHDSIDMSIAFRQSRHDDENGADGDYINCPMTKDEYLTFIRALLAAETAKLRDFETEDAKFFEGCMPVEQMASRGEDALRFGPMRPVGLIDPRTGKRPYAVVQLRQDDVADSLYNIVGFQTNLRWGVQAEVLKLIPGLANADFVRLGQMHRNTYIKSPAMLHSTMQFRSRSDLFFAGQIVGVEGYVGNAGTGMVAGLNAARLLKGNYPVILPTNTMLGALCNYVTHATPKNFQPMKANFGLFAQPEAKMGKMERYTWYSNRSLTLMRRFTRAYEISWDREAAETVPDLPRHADKVSV